MIYPGDHFLGRKQDEPCTCTKHGRCPFCLGLLERGPGTLSPGPLSGSVDGHRYLGAEEA